MSDLVIIQNGKAVASSLSIAEHTNNSHQAILKLINKYKDRFDRKSRVGFEIQPFMTAGGIQQREVALLDERQATLLMTMLRNSGVVLDFKEMLVDAFLDARNLMLTSQMGLMQKHAILTLAMKDEKQVASGCGKGLSDWKKKRDNLQSSLDEVEFLMQPMLTNLQLH